MGIFRIVEAFPGDLNKNSNYRGFRISEVRIGKVLLYIEIALHISIQVHHPLHIHSLYSNVFDKIYVAFLIRVNQFRQIGFHIFGKQRFHFRQNLFRRICLCRICIRRIRQPQIRFGLSKDNPLHGYRFLSIFDC